MKVNMKKIIGTTIILLAGSLGTLAFAQNKGHNCPVITPNDIEDVLNTGTYSNDQGTTLADEAKKTRAQVLINEPTANPFDTYFRMFGVMKDGQSNHFIYIGNVLGKDFYEAKERVKMILLKGEKFFNGVYDPKQGICMYKEIHASTAIPNYPFKSKYESVVLIGGSFNEDQVPDMMMKKFQR